MRRALGVSIVIALALTAAAGTHAAPRAKTLPRQDSRGLPAAEVALQRALAIFRPGLAEPRFRITGKKDPRAATMVLRDLAATMNRLSPADRRLAASILARPTDTGSGNYTVAKTYFRHTCPANFCVHWVVSGRDAPSLTDRAPKNKIPDWIDKVKSVMTNVWSKEIGTLGYKKPKADAPYGGHRGGNPNSKLDVFIADLGRFHLYGYCTTDDPKRNTRRDVSAYCVLDDDYAKAQFPSGAYGLNALKVTAAHEFHHASQFAYDWLEDRAFMEATATNMEADVYGSIHDNYQYFQYSPLTSTNTIDDGPWWPIDMFDRDYGNQYGDWIFYRFLEEYFGSATHPSPLRDPSINREIWSQAKAEAGTPNGGKYSTQALIDAIAARGGGASFPDLFATFGYVNAVPSAWYVNGAGYPAAGTYDLGPYGAGAADSFDWPMLHMANDYAEFQPDSGSPPSTIDFTFAYPAFAGGWKTTVLVFHTDSTVTVNPVTVDAAGNGSATGIDFDPATVEKVVLVLTNHGTDFDQCGTFSLSDPVSFSCRGNPLDDFVEVSSGFFHFDVSVN